MSFEIADIPELTLAKAEIIENRTHRKHKESLTLIAFSGNSSKNENQ